MLIIVNMQLVRCNVNWDQKFNRIAHSFTDLAFNSVHTEIDDVIDDVNELARTIIGRGKLELNVKLILSLLKLVLTNMTDRCCYLTGVNTIRPCCQY